MKKLVIVLFIILSALLLSSCVQQTPRYKAEDMGFMRVVDRTLGYTMYVDSENGVMYFCRDGNLGRSVTVMYEPDGSIKVHPDFKNEEEIP